MPKTTEYVHQLGNRTYTSRTRWVAKGMYETNFYEATDKLAVGFHVGSVTLFINPSFSRLDDELGDILRETGVLK